MSRQLNDLMLGSLELFCLAAELEGFAAAARSAGVTPAAVSRSIVRLENRLGVRLFARSTRRIRLTDYGRAYYSECRQALDRLIEAEREISGQQARPSGTIRMSLPTPLGHLRVLPLLPAFRRLYPEVKLDVHLSNRNVDIVAEGYDLAIRGRSQPDSGLVARRLLDDPLLVVASPTYLKAAGIPNSPEQLASHECIQFVLPSSGQRVPWLFHRDGDEFELYTDGSICCSEDILGTITLAHHDAGLLQVPRFMVEEQLRKGILVEVLGAFAGATRPFSLIYPAARHMPLRMRLFIDFLLAQIGKPIAPDSKPTA